MKKKIAILGSTGSIGKSLLKIIEKDQKNFKIVLLSANKNYKELLKQSKKFNVKNIIINNNKSYKKFKISTKSKKIKVYNNFNLFNKIFKNKIDYVMSSITGLDGLKPTIEIIKFTKSIAIANKESIICGWNIINQRLKRHNTDFIPVDSEHFSIWYSLRNKKNININKIYLTASGGPLLKVSKNKFKNLKVTQVLKHPNWKMGKKISVDSSTMMNKVFEIIEAKKIFNLSYKKLHILIHPKSYVHAIIKFDDGMIKVIAHDTTMKIPIFNTLYTQSLKKINSKNVDIKKLNNLELKKIDLKKFPTVKLLKKIPPNNSLFETIIVSANDTLVNLFLRKKIKYSDISKKLLNFTSRKEFAKMKRKTPKNASDILRLDNYVRLKINSEIV